MRNLKKSKYGIQILFGIMVLMNFFVIPSEAKAKAVYGITGEEFFAMLQPAIQQLEEETKDEETYGNLESYMIKIEPKKRLNRAEAICIVNQIDQHYSGNFKDNDLYRNIAINNRIGDISQFPMEIQANLLEAYGKGIIVGKSKGMYTGKRELDLEAPVTRKAANLLIERLVDPTKRRNISFDGQVIRTTNLPKNYKSYPYVLEGYPNEFYEMDFRYNRTMHSTKPKKGYDYIPPIDMANSKYMDQQKFEKLKKEYEVATKNLALKLNYDYRTSKKKWREDLASTYCYLGGKEAYKAKIKQIREYQKQAEKNQLILKVEVIATDPGTLYYAVVGDYHVRCYVKFKVVHAKNVPTMESDKQNEIIFSQRTSIKNLAKGNVVQGYFDISLYPYTNQAINDEKVGVLWDVISDDKYRIKNWKPEDYYGEEAKSGYFVDSI